MTVFIVIVEDGTADLSASDVTGAIRQEVENHGLPASEIGISAMRLEPGFSISDISPLPVVDAA